MRYFVIYIFIILFSPLQVISQEGELKEYIADGDIKSVKLHIRGLPLSEPILNLETNAKLLLTFDDLAEDQRFFNYELIHCDQNWNQSEITEFDFIQGFNNNRIDNYELSTRTLINYSHYRLELPNEDVQWTISGNYILKVKDDDTDETILTRRFMIVDTKIEIQSRMIPVTQIGKSQTHQEFNFTVINKKLKIRNPRRDIRAVVMQNGRWDSAIMQIEPQFIKQDHFKFSQLNKFIYPASKEFRFVDLRTIISRTEKVSDISKSEDNYIILTLYADTDRSNQHYTFDKDINGRFLIDNKDFADGDISGDYVEVDFMLDRAIPFEDKDIYLFGEMTDWVISPEYRLDWDPKEMGYTGTMFLKQGFYNYLYAVVDPETKELDLEFLEGNWYETENDYTVLIYYTPFGSRYDQLIGVYGFDSIN